MTTVSRTSFSALALAAMLMGAVTLPAVAAQTDPVAHPATPVPSGHAVAGPEAVKAVPARPGDKTAEKSSEKAADKSAAAMTGKVGSHAPATATVPGTATPVPAPATGIAN